MSRTLLAHRFPYSVVFVRDAEVIHVLAFAHAKRSPAYWRDRR